MRTHKTREAWLVASLAQLKRLLAKAGAPAFPQPLISVGLPSKRALAHKTQRVGECWHEKASNGRCTVFVSPVLNDPTNILAVLLHELIHAAVGVQHGHRRVFADVAQALGFVAPLSTVHPSPPLATALAALADRLGPFPHAPLSNFVNPIKKAATRLRLYECNKCGQKLRAGSDTLQIMHLADNGVFLLKDAPDRHKLVVFKRSIAPEARRTAGALQRKEPTAPADTDPMRFSPVPPTDNGPVRF